MSAAIKRHWLCVVGGHKYKTRLIGAGETLVWTTCRRCGFNPGGSTS